jgi:glycosyltransferase involved in cell wall biosynthesis
MRSPRAHAATVSVLQSFPHKIGAARICDTAWYQASGVAEAGADLLVMPGAVHRALPAGIRVKPTLARGRARIPYKALGSMRAFKLHDRLVARALPKVADRVDIVHAWPLGALETLRTARQLGIPTVLERPNAHTRFAYGAVQDECARLGVPLPPDHEHAFDAAVLEREEAEYAIADRMLCPSEFVSRTFADQGFSSDRLARHFYGYDERRFYPPAQPRPVRDGLAVLFVGVCAVRKGLHFALEAWLSSSASETGTFMIAGEFIPRYHEKLARMLSHPSVRVLGHRTDVPELMRHSDVLVLPSIEEGSALVCGEALASGCVPLISDASTAVCEHDVDSLVHRVGDVATLSRQFAALSGDRGLLERLRAGCLRKAPDVTWTKAGARLFEVYQEVVSDHRGRRDERSGVATAAMR